jgi:hypothetical protein
LVDPATDQNATAGKKSVGINGTIEGRSPISLGAMYIQTWSVKKGLTTLSERIPC